jgi:hypothetical protein
LTDIHDTTPTSLLDPADDDSDEVPGETEHNSCKLKTDNIMNAILL